jgi:hypothetical protein
VTLSHALLALLRAFAGICSLRLTPQDLPPSRALLALTTFAYYSLSAIGYSLQSKIAHPLFKALLEITVVFAATFALLFVMSYGRRLLQTLTALMGCGTLITAIALLSVVVAHALPPPLGLALLSAITLINLLVTAHILRHAVSTWFLVGLLFAFGYERLVSKFFMIADALLSAPPA